MGALSLPIEKLVARLTFHVGGGQILAGYKFESAPVNTTEGLKDLPGIRLYIPAVSEAERNAFVVPSVSVNLLLATKRTTSPNALVDHMKGLEAVLDALDTNALGQVDRSLDGSLRQPFTVRTGSQYMLDLSVNSELTLTLEPRASVRGSRR